MASTNWTTGDLVTAADLNALEGVVGAARDTTVFAHSTASRTVAGTITIPTSWATFIVKVDFAFKITSTSGTRRLFTVTPRFDGAAVSGQAFQHTIETNPTKHDTVAGFGYFSGSSATTGSRAFDVVIELAAIDANITTDDVVLFAQGWRLS